MACLLNIEYADIPSPDSSCHFATDVEVDSFAGLAQSDATRKKRATTLFFHIAERGIKIILTGADSAEFEYVCVL